MVRTESNCVGFVFYKLGLEKVDKLIWPLYFGDLLQHFVITDREDGDAIGVVDNNNRSVLHLAAVDQVDREFVEQRTASGGPIMHMSRKDAFDYYKNRGNWIVNLKLREKSKV